MAEKNKEIKEQEQITLPQELTNQVNEYQIRKSGLDVALRDYVVASTTLISNLIKQLDSTSKELIKVKQEAKKEDKVKK